MFIKAAEEKDILPGGMKAVKLQGLEIVLCNFGGAFYAVERACGHANARLERGALTGWILTCPLHYAQFDIRNGEALFGPADPSLKTRGLKTWTVKTEEGSVYVDLP